MLINRYALAFAAAALLGLTGCGKNDETTSAQPEAAAPVTEAAAPAAEPAPEPAPAATGGEKVIYVYNWSDYIDESLLEQFTKETGIKVVYDVFDSNEVLEAKLLAGNTGFDVVVPSGQFLGRQVQAGVFQKLDKSKLPNWKNLDPKFMKMAESYDPGNEHAFPYLWGTTGIGYNVAKVKAALGENAPVDSWDLILKPEYSSKLKDCGITVLDAQSEIMSPTLNYLGKNPNSLLEADYKAAGDLLAKVRPNIRYFHSSQYINDLANGDVCVSVGWSGDIFIAKSRAEEAKNGIELDYKIPKEGTELWMDMLAMPKDAKHVAEAHEFLNFLLRPEVIAKVSNFVTYANPNSASLPFVDDEVKNNPSIYPPESVTSKLWSLAIMPNEVDRVLTREWTRVKTGQ